MSAHASTNDLSIPDRIQLLEQENARLRAELEQAKRLEHDLRRSEDTFRGAVENASIGMALFTPDGNFVDCNQAYCELVGYSADELTRMRFGDLVHPEDRDANLKLNERLMAGELPSFIVRNRYVRKDGQVVWVRKSISRVSDGQGQPKWLLALVEDFREQIQAEQERLNSERIYRAIGESFDYGFWINKADGRLDYISPAISRLTGLTQEEVSAGGWVQALHPDDAKRVLPAWQEFLKNGGRWDVQFRVRGVDGEYRTVIGRGTPVRDPADEIIAFAGFNLDISEVKKVEDELRKSERIYRAIGESIPFGIWICDADGRNTYASQSLLDLLGMSQEQISEFGWGDALHPDDAERTIAAWKECVRTEGVWNIEHRYRGVDGKYHPILARGVPVRDEDGKLLCWAGINLDISDLKKTEEELRVSEERFRVALQNSPVLVSTQDPQGRYTWIYNPALGRGVDQIIGKTDQDLTAPQQAAELTLLKRSVLQTGVGKRQEMEMPGPDGTMHVFDTTVEPLRDETGKVTGLTIAAVDVTESRQREREVRESQVRIELRRRLLDQREQERLSLARDVHDGPVQMLAALNMELDMARRGAEDSATRLELGRIRRHLQHAMEELRGMVGELRSSLLQGVGLTRAMRLHAHDYLRQHPGLEVTWHLEPARGRLGTYGELALFRIYQEALSNVVKHAHATKASVRLSFTDGSAVLEVRDNGKGMDGSPDLMEQTARGHYGLAGMQERAEAVSGELKWVSKPGKGTTVIVRVPLEEEGEAVRSKTVHG